MEYLIQWIPLKKTNSGQTKLVFIITDWSPYPKKITA